MGHSWCQTGFENQEWWGRVWILSYISNSCSLSRIRVTSPSIGIRVPKMSSGCASHRLLGIVLLPSWRMVTSRSLLLRKEGRSLWLMIVLRLVMRNLRLGVMLMRNIILLLRIILHWVDLRKPHILSHILRALAFGNRHILESILYEAIHMSTIVLLVTDSIRHCIEMRYNENPLFFICIFQHFLNHIVPELVTWDVVECGLEIILMISSRTNHRFHYFFPLEMISFL